MSMSMSKALFASILISLLILHLVQSYTMVIILVENPSPGLSPLLPKIDCDGACNGRCKLSSRPKVCKRACGTCCDRCNCVPSQTKAHFDGCPCYYANMTTNGAKHKCP